MSHPAVWNPFEDWTDKKVDWVRINISKEDLKRFTQRSNAKGLFHAIGFLALIAATGTLAYWSFANQYWIIMVIALYFHGMFYNHFGDGIHELTHNTVFESKKLSTFFTTVYGLLYWVWNPYMYQLSHQTYHHRYTLHQGSDGEDAPGYTELSLKQVLILFFKVFYFKDFLVCIYRLFTIQPTSKNWRSRGVKPDKWEQFILERASDKQRNKIYRFAIYTLIFQVLFVTACILTGQWFLIVLVTLSPFYGPAIHGYLCSVHQHTACEANEPDYRISCGHARLDPLSSFLYWHMEYHIEHHMFAGIPCYNLKKFYQFTKDQMPPMEWSIPRIFKLNKACAEKYGSWQYWRDNFGRFKGF